MSFSKFSFIVFLVSFNHWHWYASWFQDSSFLSFLFLNILEFSVIRFSFPFTLCEFPLSLKMLWSLVSTVLKYFLFYSEQLPCFWFKSTQSCLPSNYIRLLLPNPLSVQINSICMHIILFRISQTCASYFMMNWISCFDVSMFLINFFFIQGLYLYIYVVFNFFVIWYLNCDLVCLRWTKRQMPKIWHL